MNLLLYIHISLMITVSTAYANLSDVRQMLIHSDPSFSVTDLVNEKGFTVSTIFPLCIWRIQKWVEVLDTGRKASLS